MWTPIIIVVHIICVGLVKKQTLWLSFIILLSILTKFYISSISCVRQCLVQAACEMGDLSDFQKVQIMEAHLTGVSVTLTAQLFSVLSRNYCKVIANLNIHHEDPVSTKTDQKELYKANVHERAAIAKTLIKDTSAKMKEEKNGVMIRKPGQLDHQDELQHLAISINWMWPL